MTDVRCCRPPEPRVAIVEKDSTISQSEGMCGIVISCDILFCFDGVHVERREIKKEVMR